MFLPVAIRQMHKQKNGGKKQMISSPETMRRIDGQIRICSDAICRHIDSLDFLGRGAVSQDILKKLRDFVEHIMLIIYAGVTNIEYNYDNITNAISFVKTKGDLKFLWRFHAYLQIVASHYTLDPENSERVMLKYYEYLLKIKGFLKERYSIEVLQNLDKFPLNIDKSMQEYYQKIAEKVNRRRTSSSGRVHNDRFYVYKIKAFFVGQRIYYEVTFIPASGRASKFDRIIAFTALDISRYYAVKLEIEEDHIQILGKTMPIYIIGKWETSIRPCEIRRFSNIFGEYLDNQGNTAEYKGLMLFLTQTGFSLVELLCFEDAYYDNARRQILSYYKAKASQIFDLLDKAREIIKSKLPGCNVLRYLLYHLNNKVISDQLSGSNNRLSGLSLMNGCIPFDKMPFNTSLKGHNPKLGDLFDCIDSSGHMHEILARVVHNNTEKLGQLYTPVKSLEGFSDVDVLIGTYNDKLYHNEKHQGRRIEKRNQNLYIRSYENDTIDIIQKLVELSRSGIQNYTSYVDEWLTSGAHTVDCDEKKAALRLMFEKSTVTLIYGSAGTGKSTLINHISHLFSKQDKLYLANTNPAVDNLKRRVDASNCEFMTTTRFIKKNNIRTKYELLIIDECSTVNNSDMREILEKADFDLLILVGDIYQIEAIQFGNWFTAARGFLPTTSVYELTKPYRSTNKELLTLWDKVRHMDDTIIELIARQGYSVSLDASIFNPAGNDEIILCLNYDGLYGINNINRFLQQSNSNLPVLWGLQLYKVGDPVLFNESERFAPLIYNNMKGWIAGITILDDQISFDIELDKVINGLEARGYDFKLLPSSIRGHSVIRFLVNKYRSADEDDDASSSAVVPFQVSYAVSIHKAQGLEYSSVKIVITDEIDDLITHDIFYTAITRARDYLKIYWTPEVEKRVLSRIKPKDINRDVALLTQANKFS
jgi:energy-coupling factor transporter ATP-binding protein EcfA2